MFDDIKPRLAMCYNLLLLLLLNLESFNQEKNLNFMHMFGLKDETRWTKSTVKQFLCYEEGGEEDGMGIV